MEVEFTYHSEYFKIALDNHESIKELNKERETLQEDFKRKKNLTDEDIYSLAEKSYTIGQHALVVIIFATLSVEAYINDYAITHLSKNYLESHLDKLDLSSKWLIIPRLVTGKQLDSGSKPMQDLSSLIALRNKLVHYKSRKLRVDKIKESDFLGEDNARKSIETVRNLLKELEKLDERVSLHWLRL